MPSHLETKNTYKSVTVTILRKTNKKTKTVDLHSFCEVLGTRKS